MLSNIVSTSGYWVLERWLIQRERPSKCELHTRVWRFVVCMLCASAPSFMCLKFGVYSKMEGGETPRSGDWRGPHTFLDIVLIPSLSLFPLQQFELSLSFVLWPLCLPWGATAKGDPSQSLCHILNFELDEPFIFIKPFCLKYLIIVARIGLTLLDMEERKDLNFYMDDMFDIY